MQRYEKYKEEIYPMNQYLYRRANDTAKYINWFNPDYHFKLTGYNFLRFCEKRPELYIPHEETSYHNESSKKNHRFENVLKFFMC